MPTVVELADSLRALEKAVRAHDDPKRLMLLASVVKGWQNSALTIMSRGTDTLTTFTFDNIESPERSAMDVLRGSVPELFNCDDLTILTVDTEYQLRNGRALLASRAVSTVTDVDIRSRSAGAGESHAFVVMLRNYWTSYIPVELRRAALVYAALNYTFMSCSSQRRGLCSIAIDVLGDREAVNPKSEIKRQLERLKVSGQQHARLESSFQETSEITVTLRLLAWSDKQRSARKAALYFHLDGEPVAELSERIGRDVESAFLNSIPRHSRNHLSFVAEYCCTGLPPIEFDGPISPQLAWLARISKRLIAEAAVQDAIRGIAQEAAESWEEEQAERLKRRQLELANASIVVWKDRALFQVPESEQDVLGLFFKLEGLPVNPIARALILEYTPRIGTDAIGHVQLHKGSTEHRFALIEFELDFAGFIRHGHTTKHTDLVICWRMTERDPLTPTSDPWLFQYAAAGKLLPVVVVSRFPGLEVKDAAAANL